MADLVSILCAPTATPCRLRLIFMCGFTYFENQAKERQARCDYTALGEAKQEQKL